MRIWHDEESGDLRLTLENAHTGERKGFTDLQSMVRFLEKITPSNIRTNPW